jgi:hypothetical protein
MASAIHQDNGRNQNHCHSYPADTVIFKLLLDNVKAIGGCILCACELEVPEASA